MTTWHKHRHTYGSTDPWICHVCGEAYPVDSLARECEAKHETNQPEGGQ